MSTDKFYFKGTGVYKLDVDGLLKKMPKREIKARAEQDKENQAKLVEAILDHYELPYKNRTDVEKYRAAIYHYMTCTDPTHAHDITKVTWEPPESKEEKK